MCFEIIEIILVDLWSGGLSSTELESNIKTKQEKLNAYMFLKNNVLWDITVEKREGEKMC